MKLPLLLLTGLLCASLTACGGGGGNSGTASGFNSTAFQGDWKRTDGTDTACFNFPDYGGSFWGLNDKPTTITETSITSTVTVFSDATCTTKVGLVVRTASVTWSAGAVAGKTNVARVLMTTTAFTKSTDASNPGNPGTGNFSGMTDPTLGVATKGLLAVDGSWLYVNPVGSPLDADGYPTTLMPSALYKR